MNFVQVTKKKGPAAKPLPIGYGHTYRIDEAPADEEVTSVYLSNFSERNIGVKYNNKQVMKRANWCFNICTKSLSVMGKLVVANLTGMYCNMNDNSSYYLNRILFDYFLRSARFKKNHV